MYTQIWISQQTISKCIVLDSLMKHNVFYQTNFKKAETLFLSTFCSLLYWCIFTNICIAKVFIMDLH